MSKPDGLLCYSLWIVIASFALTGISANVTNLCDIYDSEIDVQYNLNKLIGGNTDLVVLPKSFLYNDTLRMQLCTPLMKKCNGEDGFAMCMQYENGTERAIGRFPPRVSVWRGKITFRYPGTICLIDPEDPRMSTNHTIEVYLYCDYLAVGDSHPEVQLLNRFGCRVYLMWKTALVCGPRFHVDCKAVHNNEHYDLTSLTRYSGNYNIRTETARSSKLVLNICHSVIREPASPCSVSAGACMYNKKLKKYINLGSVQDSPVFKDGHVLLEYHSGDICDNPNSTSLELIRYRTTVVFVCSFAFKYTIPEYAGKIDECHYQVIWNTLNACSVETQLAHQAYKPNDCTIFNPLTKSIYNLQPLMNINYRIEEYGIRYRISVCGPVTGTSCEAGTGICDMQYHLSLGKANSQLVWDMGGPYLRYEDGGYCGHNKRHVTLIGFICGPEKLSYEPKIVEEEQCFTVIHWNTKLVCESRIECITDDDDEINLTPLIQYKRNYVAKHDNNGQYEEYHINICRSLVPTSSLTCEHGSAACLVHRDSDKKYTNEISLGYPVNRPTLNHKQQTVLRYIHGSPCAQSQFRQLSTNITFICGNNTQGSPVYAGMTDCTYMFTWATRLACKTMIGTWMPPCTVIETLLDEEYDLSMLYSIRQTHYVKGNQGKEYSINICNNENYCNGSAVCDDKTNNYGSLTNILFDYKHGDIKLEYLNGSQCDNDSYTSTIRLICSESVSIGKPRLLLESECSVQFEWETGMICAEEIDIEAIMKELEEEMSIITTEEPSLYTVMTVIMTVSGIMLVLFAMFIVTTCYQDRSQIPNSISTCYNRCISYFRRWELTSMGSIRYMTTDHSDRRSSVSSLDTSVEIDLGNVITII